MTESLEQYRKHVAEIQTTLPVTLRTTQPAKKKQKTLNWTTSLHTMNNKEKKTYPKKIGLKNEDAIKILIYIHNEVCAYMDMKSVT